MNESESTDLREQLAALMARWRQQAEDARLQSQNLRTSDIYTGYFYQGAMKTFQQVIADLEALLTDEADAPAPEPVRYLDLSMDAAQDLMQKAQLFPREINKHPDGAFTAVFSRLQPNTQARRIDALIAADPRIVILDQGKLAGTNDPFIDFAFRAEL